jgi:hypothetical protein
MASIPKAYEMTASAARGAWEGTGYPTILVFEAPPIVGLDPFHMARFVTRFGIASLGHLRSMPICLAIPVHSQYDATNQGPDGVSILMPG